MVLSVSIRMSLGLGVDTETGSTPCLPWPSSAVVSRSPSTSGRSARATPYRFVVTGVIPGALIRHEAGLPSAYDVEIHWRPLRDSDITYTWIGDLVTRRSKRRCSVRPLMGSVTYTVKLKSWKRLRSA